MTEYIQGVSVRLAATMNRRRFMRRVAGSTFAGVAALAAGRLISPTSAFAYASYCEGVAGPGCPKGCGPSRCCSSHTGGCQCSDGSNHCKSGTANCHGYAGTWGGQNCWTCTYNQCIGRCYYRVSTTCCDCATSGCDSNNRCIAYTTSYTIIGGCPSCPSALPAGTLAGVATGNPATSWGIQPTLAPPS